MNVLLRLFCYFTYSFGYLKTLSRHHAYTYEKTWLAMLTQIDSASVSIVDFSNFV